ncbi:MAG: PQQ-binding-like beta-propeller repeat protein [Actinomycetota bacterium]
MLLAASLERAVIYSAELLLGAGVLLALAWGLLRKRVGPFHWGLLGLALAALGAGAALGAWSWHEQRPRTVRGSPTEEFSTVLREQPTPKRKHVPGVRDREQWPTYGYDVQRTHLAPAWKSLRPPFHGLWKLKARADIEFPPSVAYGKVYVAQQKGRFYAINARTGKIVWTKHFPRCAAASPTIRDGIVYQAFMHELPCQKHAASANGFVVAWNARNGKELWRVTAGSVESSPLLVNKMLYFGSWDRRLYAYRIRGERRPLLQWTFTADNQVVAAPAYAEGLVYIASSSGSVYGVNAHTGRMRWHATSFAHFGRREYFYATPTVAYGRVFVGNADGTVYAFGAGSGHLLWARRVGTYVYTAAAVWRKTVFVGTWDGYFVALDARTGDIRWRYEAPASITGAPTVLAGLVYFSTCGRCGIGGLRRVKVGPRVTLGLNARNGSPVWRFGDGKYSALVADGLRIYVAGRNKLYALIPQARWLKLQKAKRVAKCARIRRPKLRARCLSKARRGTSFGKHGSKRAARTSKSKSRQRLTTATRHAAGSRVATQ